MPYCDNLTILGLDPVQVNSDLEAVMLKFRGAGFELHEVEPACSSAAALG